MTSRDLLTIINESKKTTDDSKSQSKLTVVGRSNDDGQKSASPGH